VQEVQQWQTKGDAVIVMADMNEDVEVEDIKTFCWTTQLVEQSILHGSSPTPTHKRGRKAINGIFISLNLLEDAQGGFLPFGEVTISDHWAVWLDILAHHFNKGDMPDIIRPTGR